jgi:GntR family transcriptional repressor for pyruvate dehydrogenase complex
MIPGDLLNRREVQAGDHTMMQPLRTWKADLSEQVANRILTFIATRQPEIGSRLPSIEKLANQLEVSQASVREAIKLLDAWGVVTVRHGVGVFIAGSMENTLRMPFKASADRNKKPLLHLHQLREALEPDIAAIAAQDCRPEHIEKIEAALLAMDQSVNDPEAYIKADLDFHAALAESTGNDLFLIVIYPIIDLMEEGKRLVSQSPGMLERAQAYHRRLFTAIKAGAAVQASETMRLHLKQSWKEIQTHTKAASAIQFKRSVKGDLSDRIVQQVLSLIVDNQLEVGDRLPPIEELCRRFDVSRTSIRESIKLLDAWGVITVKHGIGIFVSGPTKDTLRIPFKVSLERGEQAIPHLHQLREALEPDIAALAAQNARPEEIKKIEDAGRAMEESIHDPAQFIKYDLAFHSALAEATGNELFLIVIHSVVDLLQNARSVAVQTPGAAERAQQYHMAILDQIKAGNPEGARETMKTHLVQAWSETQPQINLVKL